MRQFIDIIAEATQNDPSAIVKEFRDEWVQETGKTPQQINSGMCFDFSDELERTHSDLFQSVGLGNFMNHDSARNESSDDATGFDLELLRLHYPAWQPPQGWTWASMFEILDDGCHGWAFCPQNNLCYDIEAVEGVKNPFELPWFTRYFASHRSAVTESANMSAIPHVVYHGTNASFDRFEKPAENRMAMRSAVGFWFSASRSEAASYGSRVVAARLNIKKPRRLTRRKLDELAVSYPLPEMLRRLKAGGHDGLIVEAIKADPIMDEPGKAEEYVVFSADQIEIVEE